MNLLAAAKTRYATKAYDPARKVPQETIDGLLELLRHSPSSVNSQPWHFVVASSDAGKERLAKGAQGNFSYNAPKIRDASYVILLCASVDMTPEHLEALLEQEARDGRFAKPEARAGQQATRNGYVTLHRYEYKDLQHWMEKQVYLALGTLLLGAAAEGIDATPMEGIDHRALDLELGLREQGLTSVVMVSLGYRGEADFNAGLPKSRLPAETVFTYL
ncbi:oxygen-insensitive NAD(P)H nitroreductase [Stutzerimonas azotifigens]|uniref:oxygen-insensitive NAD(P)H nitroreductase n=1 Tax=Stutzerimonas azotifigens TaxID=291995 RepID=UPI00041650EB|nr:oxygen-insensitive NAD(P)H nitroreductase [Stutzerimonas azotifigens]